jgi:outer membrane protein assembly factor BamB
MEDSHDMSYGLRFCAIVAVFALAAGCNARQQALSNTNLPFVSQNRLGNSSSNDAWTTFGYDYNRSGYNPNVTNLTKSNVAQLQLRWKQNIGDAVFASPVTYGGNLIVVSEGNWGNNPKSLVYDFSTADGHLIWKHTLGGRGKMTPAIDPDAGLVILGRQSTQSYILALRLLDGSLAWRTKIRGRPTGAPVIAGGMVYTGRAGGDPPQCGQGGIAAINESTGQIAWNWNVDPTPKKGGSVWGAIAYDGANLIFGTGNTCEEPITTANGAVSLNPSGQPNWSMVAVKDSRHDSDSGGGVTLFNGLAHFINKNGVFYALDQTSGNIVWKTDLNSKAGASNPSGGFATPSTDGAVILEGSGYYKNTGPDRGGEFCMLYAAKPTEVQTGFHSKLSGMDLYGNVLWSVSMDNRLVGYVALAGGMGFVGLNQSFVALDESTGQTLWSYPTPDYINASMIVTPSGLYGADEAGNVYAFGLPSRSR